MVELCSAHSLRAHHIEPLVLPGLEIERCVPGFWGEVLLSAAGGWGASLVRLGVRARNTN